MIDPITALAAVSSAVNLVKKAVATVQDVQSLGPVLGKYFDAKAAAIEVVEKSKNGEFKGSALGKALELEMALEQAREFEDQVKMLFFQSNKMEVWQRITARAKQMEAEGVVFKTNTIVGEMPKGSKVTNWATNSVTPEQLKNDFDAVLLAIWLILALGMRVPPVKNA